MLEISFYVNVLIYFLFFFFLKKLLNNKSTAFFLWITNRGCYQSVKDICIQLARQLQPHKSQHKGVKKHDSKCSSSLLQFSNGGDFHQFNVTHLSFIFILIEIHSWGWCKKYIIFVFLISLTTSSIYCILLYISICLLMWFIPDITKVSHWSHSNTVNLSNPSSHVVFSSTVNLQNYTF